MTRYIIAESAPRDGYIVADWDGEIYNDRETAEAELAIANLSGGSCCNGQHWQLYAVTPVEAAS